MENNKEFILSDGRHVQVLYRPARVRSVMADVSPEALANRRCFLCYDETDAHLSQYTWRDYIVRPNPYPIFPKHLVIIYKDHVPQQIEGHFFEDMVAFAKENPDYTIFYNGPHCGASAPDHMHFQAVPRHCLPVEDWNIDCLPENCDITGDVNIIAWYDTKPHVVVFHRSKTRPACFFAENPEERILVSPACVEMSGVMICSDIDSFNKLTPEKFESIIEEVTLK